MKCICTDLRNHQAGKDIYVSVGDGIVMAHEVISRVEVDFSPRPTYFGAVI